MQIQDIEGRHISADEEEAFNQAIARRIADYWLSRGYKVQVWAKPVKVQPKGPNGVDRMRGCRIHEVRSDLIAGLPVGRL